MGFNDEAEGPQKPRGGFLLDDMQLPRRGFVEGARVLFGPQWGAAAGGREVQGRAVAGDGFRGGEVGRDDRA